MQSKKDTRIQLRLSKADKREFYKQCELNGLCPSKLIERWIHRFNLNAKSTGAKFHSVVKSGEEEKWEEYNDYKNP